MDKKQKVKTVFKFIGIGAAIALGIIGLICGYIGITGGFNKKTVALKSITFNVDTDKYQKDSTSELPIFVITEDEFFTINVQPTDSTELEATLKIASGTKLVKDILVRDTESKEEKYISAEKEDGKYFITLGEKFKVCLVDNIDQIAERIIKLHVDSSLEPVSCEAQIYIDSVLQSFELKYEKINAEAGSEDTFYPGDSLWVSIDPESVNPSYSLSTKNICELTKKFKSFQFRIDNENIATFERENGSIKYYYDSLGLPRVKVLLSTEHIGSFTVRAEIWDSYYDYQTYYLTDEQYDSLPNDDARLRHDHILYGGEVDGEEVEGVIKCADLTLATKAIEVGSISATKEQLNLDLFSSQRYSIERLNIKVNPVEESGSHYTSDDLKYYLNDIQMVGGYFVDTEAQSNLTIDGKYIKLSDRYLKVTREVGLNGNEFVVEVLDYYSKVKPSNCLVLSLSYEVTSVGVDGTEVKHTETKYCYIPVEINQIEYPQLEIVLPNSDNSISLYVDRQLEQQTDYYDLTNAKIQLLGSSTVLSESNSPYKTTLFVTKLAGSDNYTFSNDVIEITNKNIGTGTIDSVKAKDKGVANVYALLVKTDKDGNFVDENNQVISSYGNILQECVVLVCSDPVSVEINQQLKLAPTNTIELYYKDGNEYIKIEDGNELYTLEYSNQDKTEIISIEMYENYDFFIKLNVNDSDAFKDAFDNRLLTFTSSNNVVSIGQNLIEFNGSHNNEGYGNNYLVSVRAIGTVSGSGVDQVIIHDTRDGHRTTLEVVTKTFTLESLELSSNGLTSSDETINGGEINLVLSAIDGTMLWTTDAGKSQDKPFQIALSIHPSEAEDYDDISFEVYEFLNEDLDLRDQTIDATFIASNLKLSTEIIAPKGTSFIENGKISLLFDVYKQGKVVIIANCTKSNSTTIYSNAIVVKANYPTLEESQFNYGTNNEVYNEQTYRTIVTSYDQQITNLLEFVGVEKNKIEDNGENVEGSKLALNWTLSQEQEVNKTPLYPSLYNFEIVEIIGNENIKADDFQFIEKVVNGQSINYLVSPKVYKKTYIKIKVSTKFGYEFTQTYNYCLVPDLEIAYNSDMFSNNTLTMTSDKDASSTATLFDIKYENGEFTNNNGLLFMTSNYANSNYKADNAEKLTGYDGKLIKVVYLPRGFDISSLISDLNGTFNDDETVYTVEFDSYIYEIRLTLDILASHPLNYITVDKGVITIKAEDFDYEGKVYVVEIVGEEIDYLLDFTIKIIKKTD